MLAEVVLYPEIEKWGMSGSPSLMNRGVSVRAEADLGLLVGRNMKWEGGEFVIASSTCQGFTNLAFHITSGSSHVICSK